MNHFLIHNQTIILAIYMKQLQKTIGILAIIAVSPVDAAIQNSIPIHNPDNGHDYYLLSQNTWTASEAEAVMLKGHLVTINDRNEDLWIYNTFKYYDGVTRNLWIGLTDKDLEGSFVWISGEPVTYLNWFTGEPNNRYNEDYGHIWSPDSDAAGKWNDISNEEYLAPSGVFGVVEVIPVPEPSTYLAGLSALGMLGLFGYRNRK